MLTMISFNFRSMKCEKDCPKNSDIWLKRCGICEDVKLVASRMDVGQLELAIHTEADRVFRSSALKLIAECSDEYGISSTFRYFG